MANMFKTIEAQSGNGGPEWLSDHPNPGNRYEYIMAEAQELRVESPVRDTRAFDEVRAHLRTLTPALTSEQASRNARNGQPRGTTGRVGGGLSSRVEPPSTRFTTYTEGDVFRVSVPSNWRELQSNTTVTFAPQGAYAESGNQSVFTHGMEFGLTRNESHDLQTATEELIDEIGRGNPNLSRPSGFRSTTVAGQRGLRTTLTNQSEATGRGENIELFTTMLRNGQLLYAIGVAPRDEFSAYQNAFDRIIESLQVLQP
jgi:hypothetical protein